MKNLTVSKIWLLGFLVISFCCLIAFMSTSALAIENSNNGINQNALNSKNDIAVEALPIHNSTKVTIQINNFSASAFTSCSVSAKMSYEDTVTREVTYSLIPSDFTISGSTGTYTADFKDYGKFAVEIRLLNNTALVASYLNDNFGVTADVYNIAPINASLPVTMATIEYWGDSSLRHQGPVITNLERGKAYDWSKLPADDYAATNRMYGMYGCPYISYDELEVNAFWNHLDVVATYIKDLNSLNEDSKFVLITSDVGAGLINRAIYANNITNYSVLLYSDGSFTNYKFADTYTATTLDENIKINQKLADEWKSQELEARATGEPTEFGQTGYPNILSAIAVITADPKVTLYVTNKKLLTSNNDENAFGQHVQSFTGLDNYSIANKLETNIKSSTTATTEFKALYKFNDNYFEKAKRLGLPVLMIVGTTSDIKDLESYARLLQSYYGDKYCYYYKGHPATPTSSSSQKQETLKMLDIDDVDSNVSAELIIFFNEDIKLAGYNSSTFQSVKAGMDMAMFRMTKATGTAETAYECYKACDFWSSEINDQSAEEIKSLCNIKDRNFLIEFNDTIISAQGYDIAIWDATTAKLTYYKKTGSSYVYVKEVAGRGYTSPVESGAYNISNIANNHKVIDVDGGSLDNSANVQIYDYNNTGAQKWTIVVGSGGYCTIKNGNSDKYLDLAGAQTKSGTNIAQYEGNDTLAQKWLIIENNGGFKITSALNSNIVVDIAGGVLDNRTNIQAYASNASEAQTFKFIDIHPVVPGGTATIAEGDYYIGSAINSSKVIDLDSGKYDNGAKIQIWDKVNYNSNQAFHVSKEGVYYRIQNMATRKSLDVDSGGVICPTKVQQWDSDVSNNNQLWAISQSAANATTYVLTNVASGLVLDLSGANITNGTALDAYDANGTPAQQWSFTSVVSVTPEIINGDFTIASSLENTAVVDVENGSHDKCANVQIYEQNNTDAQKWTITTDANGFATIKNIGSGKYLDIEGGEIVSGTNVWQYDGNDSNAQKWKIYKKTDGSYSIVSAVNCFISLDLGGANTENGSNIQVYSFNDTGAQAWTLTALE